MDKCNTKSIKDVSLYMNSGNNIDNKPRQTHCAKYQKWNRKNRTRQQQAVNWMWRLSIDRWKWKWKEKHNSWLFLPLGCLQVRRSAGIRGAGRQLFDLRAELIELAIDWRHYNRTDLGGRFTFSEAWRPSPPPPIPSCNSTALRSNMRSE